MTRYPYVKRRFEDSRAPRWLGAAFAGGYIVLMVLLAVSIIARLA